MPTDGPDASWSEALAGLAPAVLDAEAAARRDHARLLARDTTLWPSPAAVTARWLGWLDSLARADTHLHHVAPVVADVVAQGVEHVVLVGMGGSSLFPRVLAGVVGRADARPSLHVLDSTDPAAVARIERAVDWSRAAVVVASKSGTTVETLAHLDRFLACLSEAAPEASGSRVIAITDPGSPLEERARSEGFGAVLAGDSDVGGRFSALSPFGLLPAALVGADLDGLMGHARTAADRWSADPWSDAGPALLATVLATGARTGRDALHLLVDPRAGELGGWIEQLVAESSGKDGRGVLPVVVGSVEDVAARARAVVVAIGDAHGLAALQVDGVPTLRIPWVGPVQLGTEALRWMQATALACAQLEVDPFDQPDVASAKAATTAALETGTQPDVPATLPSDGSWAADAGYLAVLAYVDPEGETAAALAAAAPRLARRHDVPVTLGIGPRYLHSTGQLHKGGRTDGVFLFVIGDDIADLPVPGRSYGFSRLKRAQAAGDLAALRAAGRRTYVVTAEELLRHA